MPEKVELEEVVVTSGGELPMKDVRTVATYPEAIQIHCAAATAELRRVPWRGELAWMLGISALETGRFKSMYGWNWPNIMWYGQTPNYWVPPQPDAPGSPGKFAVYASAMAGARAYWSLVRRRYSAALEAAARGDYSLASDRLIAHGFCLPVAACKAGYRNGEKMAREEFEPLLREWCPQSQDWTHPLKVFAAVVPVAAIWAGVTYALNYRR